MNFSASIYQTSGNLRSSDIYSDDELGCRFHFFRILLYTTDPVRQSVQNLEARELYMRAKKIASSPTWIKLVWQRSLASSPSTFHLRGLSASSSQALLLAPVLLPFLAFAGPPIASMTRGGTTLFYGKVI
jgi:hypothetical protein